MNRTIFLIDMNSYFASVEQVMNPLLRGKPIAVCGDGRTVVTTASYEARKFGVRTGMNLYEAKRLCPQLIPVKGNLDRYVDTTFRIHKILLRFTDQVEPFSIDECFMDVSCLVRPGRTAKDIGREVKKYIREEIGILCSVGIGPNKMVAKIASKLQKPDGLVEITQEDVPRVFAGLPVESLQGMGVGRKLLPKLKALGFTVARHLAEAPIAQLTAHFGVMGYYLQHLGRGEDSSAVRKYDENDLAKSFGHSHTLPRDTWDLNIVRAFLLMLSEKVGKRLRADNMRGRTVSLTVRYADFATFSRQQTLREPIRDGYDIYRAAWALFEKILPLKKAVRLLGVSIGNVAADEGQGFLFDNMEKRQKLTDTVDRLNRKYGDFTLKPSSVIIAENYGIDNRCGMMGKSFMKKR